MFRYVGDAPTTNKGRETRTRLLEAAEHEFGRRGYHEASVDEIVRRAGVATGTCYQYFRRKEDLLRDVLSRITARLADVVEAAAQGVDSRESAMWLRLDAYCTYLRENRGVRRILAESEFLKVSGFREHQKVLKVMIPARRALMDTNAISRLLEPCNDKTAREL